MSDAVIEHKAAAAKSIRLAILTVSDTRTIETDISGALLAQKAVDAGHVVGWRTIVRDEPAEIQAVMGRATSEQELSALLITGGTGISPRDQTVETVEQMFSRPIPGFGELFRFLSYQEIGPACILSRSSAGLIGRLVVVLLPGSRAAVELAMDKILIPELPHLVREANKS
ncbi:MAG: molybdenum cofactor biosynthesis protein B [bacterium]